MADKETFNNKSIKKQAIGVSIFIIAVIIVSIVIVYYPSLFKKGLKKSGNETLAPRFSIKSINYPGKILSPADYAGKILLINFWGTWCPPCRHEIPVLEKFYKEHKKDGFRIIGLSVNNQGGDYVLNFVKKFDGGILTYPVGMSNRMVEAEYGNIYEIPQSFIIDKNGKVVAHVEGEVSEGFLGYEFNKLNK